MPQPRKEKYSNIDGNVEIWSMKNSFDLYISKRISTNRGNVPFQVTHSDNVIIPIFIHQRVLLLFVCFVIQQEEILIPFTWVLKLILFKVVVSSKNS